MFRWIRRWRLRGGETAAHCSETVESKLGGYRLEENGQSLRESTPKERSRCGGTVSQMESPEPRDVFLSTDYSGWYCARSRLTDTPCFKNVRLH